MKLLQNANYTKVKQILIIMALMPFVVQSQNTFPETGAGNGGIQFQENLTWSQVLEKAKHENKYVFVDCFATWCAPCKKMDKEIYPKNDIGILVNEKFISVKVQMDTTLADGPKTQKWYGDAAMLMSKHNVSSFPTYLFFNSNGEIVHKDGGSKSDEKFKALIKTALDPDKQIYTLIRQCHDGKIDKRKLAELASYANTLGENKEALIIAQDYINNHLSKLEDSALIKKNNIEFMAAFPDLLKSNQVFNRIYRDNSKKVDSVMRESGYADRFLDFVVFREEMTPAIGSANIKNREPAWERIKERIIAKYGSEVAERNLLAAKVDWYYKKKNWKMYTNYLVQQLESTNYQSKPLNPLNIMTLNNAAWEVFLYSNKNDELLTAIKWTDFMLSGNTKLASGIMDTKANLLYKMGKVDDAIKLETKAVSLDKPSEEMIETLSKMKKGIKTWIMP